MNEPSILYEFPITGRVRYFLRFEYLIGKTETLINNEETPLESIYYLHQLLNLLRNTDIKSELLRHIRWQERKLQEFSNSLPVDQKKLLKIVQEKQETIKNLDEYKFPLENYTDNHFLSTAKLRFGIPGGTCNFDLPEMHAWMHFSNEIRNKYLKDWFKPFLVLKNALESTLSLMRMSADFSRETSESGYYSSEILTKDYSMIRIMLKDNPGIYPEVSTGPRQFRIYLLEIDDLGTRPRQIQQNAQFDLACCTL